MRPYALRRSSDLSRFLSDFAASWFCAQTRAAVQVGVRRRLSRGRTLSHRAYRLTRSGSSPACRGRPDQSMGRHDAQLPQRNEQQCDGTWACSGSWQRVVHIMTFRISFLLTGSSINHRRSGLCMLSQRVAIRESSLRRPTRRLNLVTLISLNRTPAKWQTKSISDSSRPQSAVKRYTLLI